MNIIERLLILNPALSAEQAEKAIAALYDKTQRSPWRSLCYQFNVPKVGAIKWYHAAQMGGDVLPLIDSWLNQIGVTEDILSRR